MTGSKNTFFMRADFDLEFLQYCDNDDLRTLCDILMYDNKGKIRMGEGLSNTDRYIECYPYNMKGMWREIADELQCYGGNTLFNYFRNGYGPSYESIVYDVCKRLKVPVNKHSTANEMEINLLVALSSKAIGEMDEQQIRDIMKENGISDYAYTKAGLLAALVAYRFANRKLFLLVINSVMRTVSAILLGRGVIIAGMVVVSRGLGVLFGPLGWILLSGWTLFDIMGPAYRVTVPAVLQVAYMRTKCESDSEHNKVSA